MPSGPTSTTYDTSSKPSNALPSSTETLVPRSLVARSNPRVAQQLRKSVRIRLNRLQIQPVCLYITIKGLYRPMELTTDESTSVKPVAYITAGNHATFLRCRSCFGLMGQQHRSVGVQSRALQGSTRSPQTCLAPHRSVPLTAKHSESDTGGLHQNHRSNPASSRPDGARNAQLSCHCARFNPDATEYYRQSERCRRQPVLRR